MGSLTLYDDLDDDDDDDHDHNNGYVTMHYNGHDKVEMMLMPMTMVQMMNRISLLMEMI